MSSSSESSSEDEKPVKKVETPPKKEKKSKKRQSEAVEEKSSKKTKNEAPEAETTGRLKDEHGNEMFEFGNLRYASVSNFKGKEYVNIREYYVDKNTGKIAPGRKGISITKAQWLNLKDLIPEIDKKL
uniref:PC4 domain-containing protein n=1 Tax=Caenorhabditis japonica TaxID=281687 RepID=A0A8R1E6Z2_CAEJA